MRRLRQPGDETLAHYDVLGMTRMTELTRRTFLGAAVSGCALMASRPLFGSPGGYRARIAAVQLETAGPLGDMQKFYGDTLGLPAEHAGDRLTVVVGSSSLSFTRRTDGSKPFYHFAFNIPENQIREARAWQAHRTGLMPVRAGLRDARFPDDIVFFRNWNAHSIFFLDPAGNVVEYIARHTLANSSASLFSSESFECVSEIGLTVDNVEEDASTIGRALGAGPYGNVSESFGALGDESGLLLLFRRGRDLTLVEDGSRIAAPFHVSAALRGPALATYSSSRYPYEIRTGSSK